MARGALFGESPFLPLNPIDYQLNYAAHHCIRLSPNTGIRRNRAPTKLSSRTSERVKTLQFQWMTRPKIEHCRLRCFWVTQWDQRVMFRLSSPIVAALSPAFPENGLLK